jgi:hypothetical protein
MESTTSQMLMTSKRRTPDRVGEHQPYRVLPLLCVSLLLFLGGCATSLPPEGPICVPERPVLENISVQEQLDIRDNVSEDLLRRIGTNDTTLKGHIRLLERMILAHDEPLGSCD